MNDNRIEELAQEALNKALRNPNGTGYKCLRGLREAFLVECADAIHTAIDESKATIERQTILNTFTDQMIKSLREFADSLEKRESGDTRSKL